ncbi:HD domain-containing phosphohydrolase [Azovibrio restrictus]|uniref:HD domain-containing phosphohydrolase n=1 Tax=Azovibrio restrictus TaxID=146938 RepID=UPI0026EF9CD0|nr:HD domain-containing phosphohydrolase [Azovibrio restrictus]MDD3484222.1 response regulator [Azovibrio restrictus]
MSTPTILCVDDEANILSALRRLFRPTGYRLLTAPGGAEALELLTAEQGQVNLVISDMRMPNMDGAQFLARVRQQWPGIVRVLLTGYADVDSTVAAINEGQIYRYISKPWNEPEVLLTVREALERQALEQEKARLEALTARQNEELKALNAGLEEKVQARTQELHLAHERLKKSFFTSIQVFANLIELRGGQMAGHSRRVADLGRRIGNQMSLEGRACNDIFLAGLLHDVGKIGLPDPLLGKPANKMNGEELGVFRKHPAKGEQALMALEELRPAARLIRSHHERFDGQGYPDGLAGLTIPLGARILALANEYDGLLQGTLSGKRHSEEEARQLIFQGKGKRYDPAVVDAFLALSGGLPEVQSESLALAPADLKPGMVLARDLISRDGVLLLATDYVLEENLIRQIQDYERSEGSRLVLHVRPVKN